MANVIRLKEYIVTQEDDIRTKHTASMKAAVDFFSNRNKLDREIWVVKHFLEKQSINYQDCEILEADEPADVAFRDAQFQVKELFPEGKRRGDEYKEKLKKALDTETDSDLLEQYTPSSISFTEIVELCSEYTSKLIDEFKYGVVERKKVDLLFYFNYVRCHEIPPDNYEFNINGFRSVSVVGNRYCSVLSATNDAPDFIKSSIGNVINDVEIY